MNQARIVEFPNRDGLRLRGMLHEPDPRIARGICVLLLSPGIKGRVGPHRLYLKFVTALVPLGFHVLRFDYSGLGDSDGSVDEGLLSDMYNTIQDGRYVADTLSAMDWMQQVYGIRRFVGSGLCGGSISALLTAAVDRRIESILSLSIPTAFDGGEANWARFATSQQLVSIRRNYFKRMFKPHSWVRFLTGKTSYYVLWRSLKHVLPWRSASPSATSTKGSADGVSPPDDTNPKFAPAFLRFIRSERQMLLIFSGRDRLRWEFDEKFLKRHAGDLEPLQSYFDVKIIPDANHILSDPAWVKQMLDHAVEWLEKVHPASITVA